MFDAANSVLAQKMSQIDGVGQVFVGGGQQPAVRVQIDVEALAGHGLSLEDVRAALASSTANQPKGTLTGSEVTYNIAATDQLLGAAAYRELIVATKNGASVRLGDVANVFDDVENNRLAGWIDGQRCVLMIIRRQPGANILSTIAGVKAALPFLRQSISPAIDVGVAVDRATTIRASVQDVERTLLLSVLLVIAVVYVFLRSARATAIPSIAVPLSLIGTFGIMYLLGYSLDNLSLMALTISTGFVVDDAIVVTENIARLIEGGMKPLEAALEGARQIGFTIVSITISLIAVFIPILMMGGIIGRLFREFAVTLSVAVALSAVVSLTVTPAMAGRLLRPARDEKPGRFGRLAERFFDGMVRGYDRGVRWVLRHAFLMLLVTIGTVGLTVFLAVKIPKGLFPQQDTGMLSGFSEASQDISSTAMRAQQERLNKIVQQDPDVDHVIAFVGGPSGAGNTGTMFISLKPYDKRKSTADEVVARLRPKLAPHPGRLAVLAVGAGPAGGRSHVADPVPVRPGGRRPRRAADLEPARPREAEVAAAAQGRHDRPADMRGWSWPSTSTATPPADWASRRRPSTTRCTTPTGSARWPRPSRRSTTTGSSWRRRPPSRPAPISWSTSTSARRAGSWSRCPASPRSTRRPRRCRSRIRGSSRPPRCPSTWRRAPRWATRSR